MSIEFGGSTAWYLLCVFVKVPDQKTARGPFRSSLSFVTTSLTTQRQRQSF